MAKKRGGIYQSVLVFGRSEPRTGNTLVLTNRTGYVNLNINGQKFYYNNKQTYNNINKVNIPNIMKAQTNQGRRNIIILTRKR